MLRRSPRLYRNPLERLCSTDGEKLLLSLRRLQCTNEACGRIHHELPDCLVPYKRHASASIESACTPSAEAADTGISAENSTLSRWKRWAETFAQYWIAVSEPSPAAYMNPGTKRRHLPHRHSNASSNTSATSQDGWPNCPHPCQRRSLGTDRSALVAGTS
jgi:hypothetical protein